VFDVTHDVFQHHDGVIHYEAIDRMSAIMEMLFMLKFSRYITENVPTIENGSAIAGIMVAEISAETGRSPGLPSPGWRPW